MKHIRPAGVAFDSNRCSAPNRAWQSEYNTERQHSAPGYQTPAASAALRTADQFSAGRGEGISNADLSQDPPPCSARNLNVNFDFATRQIWGKSTVATTAYLETCAKEAQPIRWTYRTPNDGSSLSESLRNLLFY